MTDVSIMVPPGNAFWPNVYVEQGAADRLLSRSLSHTAARMQRAVHRPIVPATATSSLAWAFALLPPQSAWLPLPVSRQLHLICATGSPQASSYHPLQPPWATDSRVAHRKWKLSGEMTSCVDVVTAHRCTNHAIKPTSLCSNSPRCKRYSHCLFSRSPPFSEPCSRNYPFYACIFSLCLAIDFSWPEEKHSQVYSILKKQKQNLFLTQWSFWKVGGSKEATPLSIWNEKHNWLWFLVSKKEPCL